MKQAYERLVLTVTRFEEDDVIMTSEIDRNNRYVDLSDLNNKSSRDLPPGPWY